ncbi:MAG: hypothetical protein BMS9Abin29_0466 [Gemmatimonadota bacterium]|nr:MAG: hypothetical protein BMS9Abin29_0466 [Gemmatimonadota bacterium]
MSHRTVELDALGEVRLGDVLGEGGRSVVYRGDWQGRPVAVKIFKRHGVEKHARKRDDPLARFEYERNLAFYNAPGLARFVAEPLGFSAGPEIQALIQERLDGDLYYFYHTKRGGGVPPALFRSVEEIVRLAHEANLFDLDLHAMNVMVIEEKGEAVPKLFDFNLVPWSERRANPWVWLMIKAGVRKPGRRDRRMLRDFHDFSSRVPVLLDYFDPEGNPRSPS